MAMVKGKNDNGTHKFYVLISLPVCSNFHTRAVNYTLESNVIAIFHIKSQEITMMIQVHQRVII